MSDRDQEIALLLRNLLSVRGLAEDLRMLCLSESASGWEHKHNAVLSAHEMMQGATEAARRLFPAHQQAVCPFMLSASAALGASGILFSRYDALATTVQGDLVDPGHFRAIQKHSESSRRIIGGLAREAREATHIAQFLINRIDGVHHAKPA